MYGTIKTPEWAIKGPEDLEYRTYKMLSNASKIRKDLYAGLLWDALTLCDEILDFLYQYDAEQILNSESISKKLTKVDWENLEVLYTTGEELDRGILDQLVDMAIIEFENVHAEIREYWRVLDRDIEVTVAGTKPYLIGDGFVFIQTPNNKVFIYSFSNPKGIIGMDWKKFKLNKVASRTGITKIIDFISEIKEKDENTLVYRVNVKNTIVLDNGLINVISSNVFMQLRKDYGI